VTQKKIEKKIKYKEKKKQKWYKPKINSFVYISNLPLDTTKDELEKFATKCGVIRLDRVTGNKKIKLYTDETGKFKGDASVSYVKLESVEMALELLNEAEIRPGSRISVSKVYS
jgi:RNA recognition motif-containing protein